jgi:hypothetical protein
LRDEHGYPGCSRIVREAVRAYKRSQAEVFVPLLHPPGAAQADFGRAAVIVAGVPHKAALFVLTLPHRNLAAAACQRGKRVRCFRVTELRTHLLEAREARVLGRLRGQLGRLDVLVLDEFGYVPASQVGAELLFDVIGTSYERTRVIVTTNLPFERWTEVLGNERLVGATLDRLTHHCHLREATGESHRLKEARRRRQSSGEGGAREEK